jgi:hypothetical protein
MEFERVERVQLEALEAEQELAQQERARGGARVRGRFDGERYESRGMGLLCMLVHGKRGRGRERAEENMRRVAKRNRQRTRAWTLLALALAASAVCPCLPPAPRRRRPRHLLFRISHSRRNPARPDPPLCSTAARRARPRSGPHHDLAHVKNGLPPQKDGTLATRDLRIDERTDVVLATD